MTGPLPSVTATRAIRWIDRQLTAEHRVNRRLVRTGIAVLVLLLSVQAWQVWATSTQIGHLRGTSQLVDTMGSGRMLIQAAAFIAVDAAPQEDGESGSSQPADAAALRGIASELAEVVVAVDAQTLAADAAAAWTGAQGVRSPLLAYIEDVDALADGLVQPGPDQPDLLQPVLAAVADDGLIATLDDAVERTAAAIDSEVARLQARQQRLLLVGPPMALVIGLALIRPATSSVSALLLARTGQIKTQAVALSTAAHASAHHLREPLRKALVFATRGENEPISDQDARRVRAAIAQAARRLDAFLRYVSVSIDSANLKRIDLAAIGQEAADRVGAPGHAGEIVLSGRGQVEADPELIATMVEELLQNAISARSPERPLRIDVHVERRDRARHSGTVLMVRDNGRGIPTDRIDQALALFGRVHGDDDGDGVGLTLAARIAAIHGGNLHVAPARPHGTLVTVQLPIDHPL